MNSNAAIVTQGHIPAHDPQGGTSASEKLKAFNLALEHLRYNNPESYIILTGHGVRPDAADLCNHVYWENECRPLNSAGLVIGMPAQYVFVDIGIKHALNQGFRRCLKLRTDSVWGFPNFADRCEEILQKEDKHILLSQQTCHSSRRIGDCIMYGDTDLLHDIWDGDRPVRIDEGLQNTALGFADAFHFDGGDWRGLLKSVMAFRDTISLKWSDFRWTWHDLIKEYGYDELRSKIFDGTFDFERHAWGARWHRFDDDGNMIFRYLTDLISEKEWYASNS